MRRRKAIAKSSPSWITTFSDLMNLLLCFFVLLFSMSTINADKYKAVVESIQNSFGVFSGDNTVADEVILSEPDDRMQYEKAEISESARMAADMEDKLIKYEIQDYAQIGYNEQYVSLTFHGALLFDSGSAQIREEAIPVIDKMGKILENYNGSVIEIEGHTDNVPVSDTSKYEDNDVLSMYRALAVADYLRDNTELSAALIKSSGRGEYVPVADNSTDEGRALNRRVEFKVYNLYNSLDGSSVISRCLN